MSSRLEIMLWVDAGWVAAVGLCCLLPAACARVRRRTGARDRRAHFLRVKRRLAEIELGSVERSEGADLREDWEVRVRVVVGAF